MYDVVRIVADLLTVRFVFTSRDQNRFTVFGERLPFAVLSMYSQQSELQVLEEALSTGIELRAVAQQDWHDIEHFALMFDRNVVVF